MDPFFLPPPDLDLPNFKFCTQCGVCLFREEGFWRQCAQVGPGKSGGCWALSCGCADKVLGDDGAWGDGDSGRGGNSKVFPACVLNQDFAGILPGTTQGKGKGAAELVLLVRILGTFLEILVFAGSVYYYCIIHRLADDNCNCSHISNFSQGSCRSQFNLYSIY